MAQKSKQWAAIIMMIALFAMIAFVTNLCSPMAVIVQNQFGASELQSQIGNYANFIAYLVMGIPSGMLIVKYGYKKGLPVKVKEIQGDYTMTTSYAYDAKGNYKTIKGFETTKFVNTYKKGLLKKRVQKPQNDGEAELVTTITYKKVKVPSKYASTVKAQTWSILNYNLNYATGGRMMS